MTTSRWSSSLARLAVLVVALGVSGLAGGPAEAPALGKTPPAFKSHVDKGLKYYEAGEFEDAIKEFQAAYALRQLPKLLLNIAQAHRKLGRAKDALGFYEFYLRVEPNPKAELKSELEAYIKQTRAMLVAAEEMKRRQEAEEKADAAVTQAMIGGGKEEPAKEDPEKAKADPGAQPGKKPEAAEVKPPAPQPRPDLAPPPVSGPAPALAVTATAPPPKQPIYKKWWLWTAVGGVVAAGVVTGAVLGSRPAATTIELPAGVDVRDQTF